MSDHPRDLAVALRDAALSMIWHDSAHEVDMTMDAVVRAAVAAVPGAVTGAVTGVDGGIVSSRHATDHVVERLDDLQTRTAQGPGPTAVAVPPTDGVVRADDLGDDEVARRWPAFAPGAVTLGLHAVLWIGLSGDVGRRSVGLVLWSDRPGVFDHRATFLASLFASQAGMLLYGARRAADPEPGLSARDLIAQAQGVLMERFGVGRDRAFEQMVKAADDIGVDVPDAARSLVEGAERRELRNRAVPVSPGGAAAEGGRGAPGQGVEPA